MRIIGGEYRSRLISMPKGLRLRPTQDKVREAVFNLIGDVTDKNVLELFAGSGAFGIEAISRGARHATFVDNNFRCTETIRTNIESLGVPGARYEIIRANALSILSRLERQEEKFDIIFLDPPYQKGFAKKCLININAYDILSQHGLVIAEYFKKEMIILDLDNIIGDKERRYGDTIISIYRKVTREEDDGQAG
ncbi:MAG: 16S rRNA (guanine(966)-N(2))-methyltransferase RsmD [Candidatus Omnitrophica bacterium]|nr:16S rRNA (guanine(966)-N(2))-methyltransferase RsmD [Candidatus Omnitrophota bacterium]